MACKLPHVYKVVCMVRKQQVTCNRITVICNLWKDKVGCFLRWICLVNKSHEKAQTNMYWYLWKVLAEWVVCCWLWDNNADMSFSRCYLCGVEVEALLCRHKTAWHHHCQNHFSLVCLYILSLWKLSDLSSWSVGCRWKNTHVMHLKIVLKQNGFLSARESAGNVWILQTLYQHYYFCHSSEGKKSLQLL